MKSIKCFLVLSIWMSSAMAADLDFAGYLRGGSGTNFKGGKQECFYNSGIPGNFMRLGNECGFYTELAITFHHKKSDEADPVYFKTQTRLEVNSLGLRQWEKAAASSEVDKLEANKSMNQLEAFVTAGGFSELPGEFWVGKRFYRDVNLYIFDWYYYADMSGIGAGVDNIPVNDGYLAIAHLFQTNDRLNATTSGRPVLQALDVRWKSIPVSQGKNLNIWGVYAWADSSSDATTQYASTNGHVLAARLDGALLNGSNNLSILYGKGAMKDLNIYGDSAPPVTGDANAITGDVQNRAWTLRVVEDWQHEVIDKWAVMLGIAAELSNTGKSENSNRQWQAIGIRPTYFMTDRFQWVLEMGYSRFEDESESIAGTPVGVRELTRFTVGPQLSFKKSIWGRPVLRAFVSHTQWNDANKGSIAGQAPAFANANHGTNFGYQFESWF